MYMQHFIVLIVNLKKIFFLHAKTIFSTNRLINKLYIIIFTSDDPPRNSGINSGSI